MQSVSTHREYFHVRMAFTIEISIIEENKKQLLEYGDTSQPTFHYQIKHIAFPSLLSQTPPHFHINILISFLQKLKSFFNTLLRFESE